MCMDTQHARTHARTRMFAYTHTHTHTHTYTYTYTYTHTHTYIHIYTTGIPADRVFLVDKKSKVINQGTHEQFASYTQV